MRGQEDADRPVSEIVLGQALLRPGFDLAHDDASLRVPRSGRNFREVTDSFRPADARISDA